VKHIVHINRHILARNRADGGQRPVYSVRRGRRGEPVYAQSVVMRGEVTLVDPRTAGALPCGATVWAEVEGEVELVDAVPFSEVDTDHRKRSMAA
jgi:hypothetical protein